MAKVKDNKDTPSYGFTGAVKEKLLGIDPATVGFSQIMSETFNPATLFGSESFLAKAFASEEQRARRAGVEKGKPIGFTSEVIEKQTQEQQKITEEQTKEIKEVIEKPKKETKKEDPRNKLKDTELEKQTDRVVAKLDEVKAAVVAFSGGGGGGMIVPGGGMRPTVVPGGKGGTSKPGKSGGFFRNMVRGIATYTGFNAMRNKFFPSVQNALPEGTRLNSQGRLIDSKTGRFVAEPEELRQQRQAVDTKTQAKPNANAARNTARKGVVSRVRTKIATKIGAKTAAKGGMSLTGVGAFAAAGLTAYDIGEYAFSKSARMQYDLALGGEETQNEAFDWLLQNDPEVLGVPEQVPQDRRMEYLQLQQDYPDKSEDDILKSMEVNTDAQEETRIDRRKDMENVYTKMLQEQGMGGFLGFGLNAEGKETLQTLMSGYDQQGKISPEIVSRMNQGLQNMNSDVRFDPQGNPTTVQALMDAEENANLNNLNNVQLEQRTDEINNIPGPQQGTGTTVITGPNQPPVINVEPQVTVTLPREIKPITESSRRFVNYASSEQYHGM